MSDTDTELIARLEACTSAKEAQDLITRYHRKNKRHPPTLLALAIICNKEKAAEWIISFHDSDWKSEVHEGKTVLLFCLITNPPRWHNLAKTIISQLQSYIDPSTSSSSNDYTKQNSNVTIQNGLLQKLGSSYHNVSTADAIKSYVMETCEFESYGSVAAIHVAAFYGLTDIIKDLLALEIKDLLMTATEKGQLIPLCFAINTREAERRRGEQNNKQRRPSITAEVLLNVERSANQQVVSAGHRTRQGNSPSAPLTRADEMFWESLDEQKSDCVKFLLQKQSLEALKIKIADSKTIAHYTILMGSLSTIEEIANPTYQNVNVPVDTKTLIQPMFLAAIEYNQVEYIKLLWNWLDCGSDANFMNPRHDRIFEDQLKSLVLQVIFLEQLEILKVLIQDCRLFTVDQELDKDGNTLLIIAMKYCCLDIVNWLLEQRANPNIANKKQKDFQYYAVRGLNKGKLRAEYFLDLFASTSPSGNPGNLIKNDLIEALLQMAACESNSTVMSRMVETFNCNAASVIDENGNTLLHLAAGRCNTELFRFLLRSRNNFEHSERALYEQLNSLNPLLTNSDNKTVLHVACEAGAAEIVQLLLQKYPPQLLQEVFEIKDRSGNNVLHCVAKNSKDSDKIFLLIECSGRIQLDELNLHNRSNSMRCTERYSHTLKQMMKDQNRDGNTPLHIAAQLQNTTLIPYLDKSNPHLSNSDGLTPTHCALLTRDEKFFEDFLHHVKQYGKFSLRTLFKSNKNSFNGLPILHFTAGLGMPNAMRLLVQNGSEFLLEVDSRKNTVLHHIARLMVCQIEKEAKLKLLKVVDEVVEAYAQTTLDRTPFSATAMSVSTARRYALNYLTRKVLNKALYSVLMYAAKKDAVEYVQYLLKAVQPEQQFDQLRSMECPVLYDVSYLTPQSWSWMTKGGVKFLTSKNAPRSDFDGSKFTQDSNSEDDSSTSDNDSEGSSKDESSTNDNDSEDNGNSLTVKLPDEERKFNFLGLVLNSKKSHRVKQLLEQSPMPEMLQNFIGAYQWFHMLILLVHLTFMLVFTYYSVTFLDFTDQVTAPNHFVDLVLGHKRNNGAFLVWPALMCVCHLLISILRGLQYYGYCWCNDKQLHVKSNANSRHKSRNIKRSKGKFSLYACVTVLLFVMCAIIVLFCVCTAIWYVGVSNCIDSLEFPFKILTIIFTVLSMLEILWLTHLGVFDRVSNISTGKNSFRKWAYISVVICFLVQLAIFCALAFTPNNNCTPPSREDSGNETNISSAFTTLTPTFTTTVEGFYNSSTVGEVQNHSSKYYAFILIVPGLISVVFLAWFAWNFMKVIVRSTKALVRFALHLIELLTIYVHVVVLYVFGGLMLGWYASSYTQRDYQLYFLAAALLIGWTYTIHFTHGIRTMHVFNVVLKRIIYEDVIRFVVLYGFIVVGFSCAMHVLFFNFEAQLDEQPSVLDTMYQVIKISVGIGDVLDSNLDFNGTNYQTRSAWAGLKVIYILFILVGNVILLNILIAMMSHRYEDIVRRETITWRYDYVSHIMSLPNFVRGVIERLGNGRKHQGNLYREQRAEDFDGVMLSMIIEEKDVIEKGRN